MVSLVSDVEFGTSSFALPAWRIPKEHLRSTRERLRTRLLRYAEGKLAIPVERLVIRGISPVLDVGLPPGATWGLPAIVSLGSWVPFVQHCLPREKVLAIYGITTTSLHPSLAEMRIGLGREEMSTVLAQFSLEGCFDLAPFFPKLDTLDSLYDDASEEVYGPAAFFSPALLFDPGDCFRIEVMTTRYLVMGEERYPLLGFVVEPKGAVVS